MSIQNPDRPEAVARFHADLVTDLAGTLDLDAGLARILPGAGASSATSSAALDTPYDETHEHLVTDLAATLRTDDGLADTLRSEAGHAELVSDLTTALDTDHGLARALKPTVVVADDDEAIVTMLKIFLELAGFDVVAVAANGQEAVDAVDRLRPDLVTMDIMMPVMDGFQATEIISLRYPGTRVVVVSARAQDRDLRRGMESGAVEYLTKPFDPDELIARLRAHV